MRPFRKYVLADVMCNGRFVHTFRISVLLADKIDSSGNPKFSIERLRNHIESRLPSLKGKPYNIFL